MNPQPDPSVGMFFATLIFCMFLYYTYKAYINGETRNVDDLFVIGYIEHGPNVVNDIKISNVNTKPSFESQQLFVDCIDALHALGMKKSQARNRAKEVFSTTHPQPQTVQEFLLIALKN